MALVCGRCRSYFRQCNESNTWNRFHMESHTYMWSLDHFGEATDQQLLLWTDPCSGATLAYNAALKSHWMETFIFKYWPQSWGRCEFSRQCPALAVCAGTGELYWENKEEFVCGSLYKTTKLESLCTLPMKIFSCLTTNRDSLKKKISIWDSC